MDPPMRRQVSNIQDFQALPPMSEAPSYYAECYEAFVNACPRPERDRLAYLQRTVPAFLSAAELAAAADDDRGPLRVLSLGTGNGEFDIWFINSLLLLHPGSRPIHYDAVEPNADQCEEFACRLRENPIPGVFLHQSSFEQFKPPMRYDIVLIAHSLHYLPRGCLSIVLDSYLVPEAWGLIVVLHSSLAGIAGVYRSLGVRGLNSVLLVDELDRLDPQLSCHEMVSVNRWMDVEDCFQEKDGLNLKLLGFCVGKDLRNAEPEVLEKIRKQIATQTMLRKGRRHLWEPDAIAVVYRNLK